MDIRMPQRTGIEATHRVVALGPAALRVVPLTTFDLDEYVFDGLLAGASGFLLKHAPPEEILLAVRAAAAGDALGSPARGDGSSSTLSAADHERPPTWTG
jgi:DNA-binding NarL/FixJ family response regulator